MKMSRKPAASRNSRLSITRAIEDSDVSRLARILSAKHQSIDLNESSCTPAHLAVRHEHAEQARSRLDKGADASSSVEGGDTSLRLAAASSGGIDLSRPRDPSDATTALHLALKSAEVSSDEAIASISSLLKNGADPNTAFRESCFQLRSSSRLIELFLSHGADVRVKDSSGRNALHLAVLHSSCATIKSLISRGADVNEKTGDSAETALILAIKSRERGQELDLLSVTRVLLESGADVNAADRRGKTALSYALAKHQLYVVQYLSLYNAVVDSAGGARSSMMEAVEARDVTAIKYFVDYTASKRSYNYRSNGLLINAMCVEDVELRYEIVRLLLQQGADADARDSVDGSTALQLCVKKRDLDLLELLIGFGADVRARNHYRESVLFVAVFKNFYEAVQVLMGTKLALLDDEHCLLFKAAIHNRNKDTIKFLLDNGVNVDDESAWSIVARSADVDVIEFLWSNGRRYEARSKTERVMLLEAIKAENKDVVEYLLNTGADVDCFGGDELPLKVCLKMCSESGCSWKSERIIDALVKHFAYLTSFKLQLAVDNLSLLRSADLRLYESCCEELERMKKVKICDGSDATYFDLLTPGESKVCYLRIKQIREALLKVDNYKEEFVNYFEKIEFIKLKALDRLEKARRFEEVLRKIFGAILPGCLVRLISEFYNDEDFYACLK